MSLRRAPSACSQHRKRSARRDCLALESDDRIDNAWQRACRHVLNFPEAQAKRRTPITSRRSSDLELLNSRLNRRECQAWTPVPIAPGRRIDVRSRDLIILDCIEEQACGSSLRRSVAINSRRTVIVYDAICPPTHARFESAKSAKHVRPQFAIRRMACLQ